MISTLIPHAITPHFKFNILPPPNREDQSSNRALNITDCPKEVGKSEIIWWDNPSIKPNPISDRMEMSLSLKFTITQRYFLPTSLFKEESLLCPIKMTLQKLKLPWVELTTDNVSSVVGLPGEPYQSCSVYLDRPSTAPYPGNQSSATEWFFVFRVRTSNQQMPRKIRSPFTAVPWRI